MIYNKIYSGNTISEDELELIRVETALIESIARINKRLDDNVFNSFNK